MTTIGYATLQIIPSLKGVSEAIKKQIDGKVVGIAIEPKVDQRATEAAGKQARETIEKQTTEVKVEPKVDRAKAEQAGKTTGEAVTKGAKDAVRKGDIGKTVGDEVTKTVEKASPGKDIAKVIVEGIADGVKDELRGGPLVDEFVDGLADGVKRGIDDAGIGKAIVRSVGDGMKSGNLAKVIKGAVLPGITGIGDAVLSSATEWSSGIGDALRAGDIRGATDSISAAVLNTTDIISNIGSTFGVQLDGVREFGSGSATTLQTVGSNVQDILDTATTMKSTFADTGNLLGTVLPGRAGTGAKSIIDSLSTIIPIANGVYEALDKITQDWHAGQQERFWERWAEDQRARATGAKPPQPGVGDFGGPPAVGQGNAPSRPAQPAPGADLRAKIAAGQFPGFSLAPDGTILGPDGKPLPGLSVGGFTGNWPIKQIAGVVHGGEWVLKAASTQRIEGAYPGLLAYMNNTGRVPWLKMLGLEGKLPGYAGGGVVNPDVTAAEQLVGTPYSQANRFDCSGTVARIINAALGLKDGGLMTTKTAAEWLSKRGFADGLGGPGDISVGWYDHGPNPNDGHMAMTLSDGRNAEAGGSHGAFLIGAGAAGASSAQFDHHMHLALAKRGPAAPKVGGEGLSTNDSGVDLSGLQSITDRSDLMAEAGTGSATPTTSSGTSFPTSITGLSTWAFDEMTSRGKANSGPGHRDPNAYFPAAASAAVGGQVSSALGVLGVPAPRWLGSVANFISGISVGGIGGKTVFDGSNPLHARFDGGGARDGSDGLTPLSLASTTAWSPPALDLETVHGARAGQQPGPPGPVYNIRTATVEDAFLAARRKEDERAAAKLARF